MARQRLFALASAVLIGLSSIAHAQTLQSDSPEMGQFNRATLEGRCDGWEPIAEILMKEPQAKRNQSTPFALASAGICAAKAERMDLAEALGAKIIPAKIDLTKDWLIDGPLQRYATEVTDLPGGAVVVLRVLDRVSLISGVDDADIERRKDALMLNRMTALYATGRSAEAAQQIETEHLGFQVDRRFEATWVAPEAAAARIEETYKRLVEDLSGSNSYGDTMKFIDAAMALGQTNRATEAARRPTEPRFLGDAPTWELWPRRIALVRAHLRTGRIEAAVEAYEAGSATIPLNKPNGFRTWALLEVAMALVKSDRQAEALALIQGVEVKEEGDDSDPLAVMRACIDPANVKLPPDDVWRNWRTSRVNLDSLLCAASEEVVAGMIIRNLQRPATRTETLMQLQTFLEPPTLGKTDALLREGRSAVLRRPDVAAAINRYGRILRLNVYRGE